MAALWSTDHVGARQGEFAPHLAVVVRADGGHTVARGRPGPGGAQWVHHARPLALLGGRGPATLQHKDDITNTDQPSPGVFPNVYLVSDSSTHVWAPSLDVLEVDHSSRSVGLYTTSQSLG